MQTYNEQNQKGITLLDCIEAPSVKKLIKNNGETNVQITIESIILMGMDNFNVKFHLTDKQIAFFAEGFIEDFAHESIDDLILCLKHAARGKYGEIYNAIDPPILFKWFRLHLENKSIEMERLQGRKKNTMQKQCDESPVNHELNKQMSQKIREELKEKKEKPAVKGDGIGERLRKQLGE